MTWRDKLISQLKRHEGFRSEPYKCTGGRWTIGYGHTRHVAAGLCISEPWADIMLRYHDLPMAERDTDELLVGWGVDSDLMRRGEPARYYAMVNMCFNLGYPGLAKFQKMWSAIWGHRWDRAADEMLDSKWAEQVGSRAVELAEQMRTGRWRDE